MRREGAGFQGRGAGTFSKKLHLEPEPRPCGSAVKANSPAAAAQPGLCSALGPEVSSCLHRRAQGAALGNKQGAGARGRCGAVGSGLPRGQGAAASISQPIPRPRHVLATALNLCQRRGEGRMKRVPRKQPRPAHPH